MPHLLFLSTVFLILLNFWSPSPAEAVPMPIEHDLSHEAYFNVLPDRAPLNNPGTISYAGGSSPLVGRNIAISDIVTSPVHGSVDDLTCVSCKLNFSSGSFAGTTPPNAPDFPVGGYSFHSGGSITITGGVSGVGISLPVDSVLFHGVLTGAQAYVDVEVIGAHQEVSLAIQSAILHPELISHFDISSSHRSESLISTTELTSPPNPFVHGTFEFTTNGEPSYVGVLQSIPLPDTFWPFALGLLILSVWWEHRRTHA